MTYIRRGAAVLILFLCIASAARTLLIPFVHLWVGKAVDDRKAMLEHLRRLGDETARIEQRVNALRLSLLDTRVLWHESSLASESSEIQGRVRLAFTQSGGDVEATTDLTPVQVHGLWRVGVGVDATSNSRALNSVIQFLETGMPHVFVEDLRVQAEPSPVAHTTAPVLTIHMVVVGYGLPL